MKSYWKKFKLANNSLLKALGLLEASMKDKLKSLGLSSEEINCFNVSYCNGSETQIAYKGESCLFYLSLEDLLKMKTNKELWEYVKVVD